MKLSAKKIIGTGFTLGLALLSLGAHGAAQFGNLPLWFEAGTPSRFTARAGDSEFVISSTGAEFTLAKNGGAAAGGRLQFAGANAAARISGDQPLAGKINYLVGSNPNQWQVNVPTFARVRVENIYPGVNLVYYGSRQKLEYDFDLAAGINPSVIQLHFDGAEKISLNPQGELVIRFSSGEIIQHAPVAYQILRGARQEIAAGYTILDAHTAAFNLGNYNRSEPLVIDPVLNFSTYYGGNNGDTGWAIAVNPADGSIYVAGQTFSTQFSNRVPFSTSGAYQTNYAGGSQAGDAFVARFDHSGTNLIYATYLGGSGDDAGYAIAVDVAGNAYVAGATTSVNFPVTNSIPGGNHIGPADPNSHQQLTDAFVTELNPGGSNLVYSTYIGGNSSDGAFGITLDPAGDAFITGFTYSTNFPVTPNAFQPHLMCLYTFSVNFNAFVSEIAAGGNTLNYSTYLGGTNIDLGKAIAFNNNRLFVAGYTSSTNFPATNFISQYLIATNRVGTNAVVSTNFFSGQHLNGLTNSVVGPYDAFVTAFSVSGAGTNVSLLYSTFLGGNNNDTATGIAADAAGDAYVTGATISTNFPSEGFGLPSFVRTNGYYFYGVTNSFLTQVKWDGTNPSIGYSTMFGQQGGDVAYGVTLDAAGNVYVVGAATSTNFPTTGANLIGSLTPTNAGLSDVFVTAFAADFSALLYSAYLGGSGNDVGYGIAIDPAGNADIVGQTFSVNFPTFAARQTSLNGPSDMFLAQIGPLTAPVLTAALSGPNVLVYWPPAGQATTNFLGLQTSTNLLNTNWVFTTQSPTLTNGAYFYTFPPTNPAQFFRLKKH